MWPFFFSISFLTLTDYRSFKSCIEMALNYFMAFFCTVSSVFMLSKAFWYILTLMSTFLKSFGFVLDGRRGDLETPGSLGEVFRSLLLTKANFLNELLALLFSCESKEEYFESK